MHADIEAVRKHRHIGTFQEAKRWVGNIQNVYGDKPFALDFDPCGIYTITHNGELLGKGMTYEMAIGDAEKNWKHITGELTLDGFSCS